MRTSSYSGNIGLKKGCRMVRKPLSEQALKSKLKEQDEMPPLGTRLPIPSESDCPVRLRKVATLIRRKGAIL